VLPVPGLDGGRLLFLLVEALRGGKRIDPQREAIIHFAGLVLLMGFVAVITYFDIVSPAPQINWGP
jgi:regulator of sigma E protease